MTNVDPARQLAKEISTLKREVSGLSRGSQMRFRSLEGGSIPVYDSDGSYRGQIGQLPDGTTGFETTNGPVPPVPSAPILFPTVGGIEAEWDGTFWEDAARPGDFRCIQIHASPYSVYTPDASTLRASLIGPGSVVLQLPAQPWTIVFVTEATTGRRSGPSISATETPEALPSEADIAAARQEAADAAAAAQAANAKALEAAGIAADKGRVVFADDPPTGDPLTLWIDLNDGNKPHRWDGSTWVLAQDSSISAAQAAAQAAQVKADQAIADAADAQATADGKVTTYFQTAAPTGLTVADTGDLWFDTDDGNKMYRWNGSTLGWVATTYGASAIAANARQLGSITTYYTATKPTSGMLAGDLWVDTANGNKLWRYDGANWVDSRDTGIQAAATAAANANTAAGTALSAAQAAQSKADSAFTKAESAQTTADGKNKVFWRASTNPPPAPLIEGDLWFLTDQGNKPRKYTSGAWVDATFGDGAISGLNVGKLVAGQIAVGQKIIAGPVNGTHAEMSDTGFRVFREDPTDGIPDEVARMGTTLPNGTPTNDYFAILGAGGDIAASIDDTGSVNGRTANFREDITVGGRSLTELAQANRAHSHGWAFAGLGNITTEIGLVEVAHWLEPGRLYEIDTGVTWTRDNTAAELVLRLRDGGANSPTISSTELGIWTSSGTGVNQYSTFQPRAYTSVTTAGMHRYLLTAERQGTGAITIANGGPYVAAITVIDHGPYKKGSIGSVNRGGGSTAPPVQQYDTGELPASAWAAYRGDGTQRTDVSGPVQGWDPSGFNGNGKGHWSWALPNITGTVDRVDVYLYSEHWYYNSGGTAILNGAVAGNAYAKYKGDFYVGGFPKPGGRWVTLPSDWFPHFKSAGFNGVRFDGITVGPGPGTDLGYYGRFTGSASRLRIWYTQ